MKLAILSDTHGLLRPEVIEHLDHVDAILHAGDIDRPAILDELARYGALYAVRGNNDFYWAKHLHRHLTATFGGLNFYIVHNIESAPADLAGIDVVIYGHTHRYAMEERSGVLWLNPGSCGPRRFYQDVTMAMMEIEDGKITVEKIVLTDKRR